ncbi:MAG TPA: putative peptidoglycan glycosyltransferase FtsW [Candidatus Saccharimonadales bacterium]|nr:putative peptidoglycan glycosyltransferase FtsW [Candidatus Saccharimonadales bacterium]
MSVPGWLWDTSRHKQSLTHRRHRPDYLLLILVLLLSAVGIIVIYAISPALAVESSASASYYVTHQILAVLIGLVAFLIADRVPYMYWRRMYRPLLILAACATLLALVMPVDAQYPAHRWIRIGAFSFQSVELLKFALIVWLAAFLSQRMEEHALTDIQRTIKPLGVVLVIVGVIVAFIQSDFGSTMVIVGMFASMILIAGMPMKRLLMVGGIIVIGAVLAISIFPYRRARLLAYLHPTSNCAATASDYQACQALIAVGSGGTVGLGLGRSVQAYGYLPEADNDSIFAIYAEKFGFVGGMVLIGLFAMLFYRIKTIIERSPDNFSRLFAVAILAWLATQTVINIGAMIGLLPLKGITLPLISYGGTSVVFIMAALGIVFRISRYSSYNLQEVSGNISGDRGYESSRDRRRIGRPYYSSTSGRT